VAETIVQFYISKAFEKDNSRNYVLQESARRRYVCRDPAESGSATCRRVRLREVKTTSFG
jgi:hypothetical protein